MRTKSIFFLLAFLPFFIQAQELMTIGEVFDFEVGDEFHSHSKMTQAMENGDRMSIIDKYYSSDNDTVFYVEQHNTYRTELSWEGGEPHFIYHFNTSIQTKSYTDLSAPISEYDDGFLLNQQSYSSSQFCDSLINKCSYQVGPGFENDNYRRAYGKGLGRVSAFHSSGMNGGVTFLDDELFYYKKNGLTCGSPDLTGVSVESIAAKESGFSIFPNPTQSEIHLLNKATSRPFEYAVMDGTGRIISSGKLSATESTLQLANYKPGVYFLLIHFDNKSTTLKVIKE